MHELSLAGLVSLLLNHTQKVYSDLHNESLLALLFNKLFPPYFEQYSNKTLVSGLSELLMSYYLPYVERNFTKILETIIVLLQRA